MAGFSCDYGENPLRKGHTKPFAKSACVGSWILQEWDCHIAAHAEFKFWKARFGGFSFFLGH
jgi:hypothetical protein